MNSFYLLFFKGIAETPTPAFYKRITERPTTGDFGYNPTLGVLPKLSLPENLPELDNYATFDDDGVLNWTEETTKSIAPSLFISNLPDINDLSVTTTTTTPTATTTGT